MIGPQVSSSSRTRQLVQRWRHENKYLPAGSAPGYTNTGLVQPVSSVSESMTKIGYRQRPPFTAPLPYDVYGRSFVEVPHYNVQYLYEIKNPNPSPGKWVTSQHFYNFYGDLAPVYPVVPTLPDPDPEGLLINEARIRAGEIHANILVTLKEWNKTCGMIRSRTKKVADVVDLVRKRNYDGAARLLGMRKPPERVRDGRAWADNFLEYQYGWLPLVADTVGYAKFFASFLRDTPIVVGKARVELETRGPEKVQSIPLGVTGWTLPVTSQSSVTERHQVILAFRLRSSMFRELNQLGALHVPSAGWELTTLSFVWDWVFKVGDLLQSMDSLVGLEFLNGSYTRSARQVVTYTGGNVVRPYPPAGGIVKYAITDFDAGKAYGFRMRRSLYDELPPPEFIVEIPFTKQRDFRRALVSTALLRQRLSNPSKSLQVP